MAAASDRWASSRVHVLERRTHVVPLGIRFWDVLRDAQVADNLQVTVRRDDGSSERAVAFRTPSGIYAFRDVAGLYDFEYPRNGTTATPPVRFVVSVEDRLRRFVPESFPVDLPLPRRGVYPMGTGSIPAVAPPGVYLFSAPGRTAVSGIAAVRGQLWDWRRQMSGAHASIEVAVHGGPVWRGVSDRTGAFAVLFPYPTLQVPLGGSPPHVAAPLASQRWRVTIRAGYDPLARVMPADGADPPLLRTLLDQPAALLWARTDAAPGNDIVADLAYGRELIVRTAGDPESRLWIGRQGSPP